MSEEYRPTLKTEAMRPVVRAYVALVILTALLLIIHDGSVRDFNWIGSRAGLLIA